jgi:hypothetical protein
MAGRRGAHHNSQVWKNNSCKGLRSSLYVGKLSSIVGCTGWRRRCCELWPPFESVKFQVCSINSYTTNTICLSHRCHRHQKSGSYRPLKRMLGFSFQPLTKSGLPILPSGLLMSTCVLGVGRGPRRPRHLSYVAVAQSLQHSWNFGSTSDVCKSIYRYLLSGVVGRLAVQYSRVLLGGPYYYWRGRAP